MVGMTVALSGAPGLAAAELGEYRVGYISQDGMRHQVSLTGAQAVRFEVMTPARRFAARKGQRHLPGLWWSSTVAGHVGYESWLERDHLIWLDWDRTVTGIASQPFWLSWTGADGKDVVHAPDFFARRADGSRAPDCRQLRLWRVGCHPPGVMIPGGTRRSAPAMDDLWGAGSCTDRSRE